MASYSAHFINQEAMAGILSTDCPATAKMAAFAQACRINSLYMIQKAGSGHIGTSFSSLEIMSWLLWRCAQNDDVFFSSKGHDAPALYAVLLGLGELDFSLIHKLRRIDGLPGHPDIATPSIATNTGSLGMGIAKAKGMAKAARLFGSSKSIYVLLGDGELQEGQIYESLQSAANQGLGEITAIVDHNKIQSDTWVSSVSDLGDLERKFQSFGWAVARCDGNDLAAFAACLHELEEANPNRPKMLIADTLKGKGVSFMERFDEAKEKAQYQYHSGAASPEKYAAALEELTQTLKATCAEHGIETPKMETTTIALGEPPAGLVKLIPAYGKELLKIGDERSDVTVLDADLAKDCGLIAFRDAHPERFHECGIAEMDMVSMAGGLALSGVLPVVHSFASFLTTRANEQIFTNATEKTKIIYAGSLAGVLPAGPGHSHQSVRDIALMGSVPGMACVQPCSEAETRDALNWAVNRNESSTYIRLVTIPCEQSFELPSNYSLQNGKGCIVREGGDAALIAYGPVMLQQAWLAADLLEKDAINLRVVNLPWLNVVDDQWLSGLLGDVDRLFTLDDHLVSCGQGAMLAAHCASMEIKVKVAMLGLREIPACGSNDEALAHHGLDAQGIAETVRQALS